MNGTNPAAEVKAALALGDLRRRERLLKIIRGKPAWAYYAGGVLWIIVVLWIVHAENHNSNIALYVFFPLPIAMMGLYLDLSRRMTALLELIEEKGNKSP